MSDPGGCADQGTSAAPGLGQALANLIVGAGAELVPRSGVWVGASRVLGQPVPFDAPYPHIHGWRYLDGRQVEVWRIACAACPRYRPEDEW